MYDNMMGLDMEWREVEKERRDEKK